MIFDTHMHVGTFESMFSVALDRDGLGRLMRENEISTGLVFYPDNGSAARWSIRPPACTRSPGRTRDARDHEEVSELLDHPRSWGVKLHPLIDGYHPNDPPSTRYRAAHRARPARPDPLRPPHLHVPWSIEELAVRYPEAKIILGHMGHGNIVYINGAIDVALRNANVYLETSGMPMHTKIREATERVGGDTCAVRNGRAFPPPGRRDRKGAGERAAARGGRARAQQEWTAPLLRRRNATGPVAA